MTKVLFLGCNPDQIPYLKRLKNLGFYVVGTDMNINAPGKGLCDSFHIAGYNDFDSLINVGKEEHFGSQDKVFTASAQFAHLGASKFAEYFKIPYPKSNKVEICLDKTSFYPFFEKVDIPIPKTFYIKSKNEFIEKLTTLDPNVYYYMKSDFSKNPNYVYRFSPKSVNPDDFFWGKDRYLREFYILQEEFIGEHLRVNIWNEGFNIFPFLPNNTLSDINQSNFNTHIIERLRTAINDLGMTSWLIKFDVLMNNDKYVVLDIGMDAPYRMNKKYTEEGLKFENYYIDQYLFDKINYPF